MILQYRTEQSKSYGQALFAVRQDFHDSGYPHFNIPASRLITSLSRILDSVEKDDKAPTLVDIELGFAKSELLNLLEENEFNPIKTILEKNNITLMASTKRNCAQLLSNIDICSDVPIWNLSYGYAAPVDDMPEVVKNLAQDSEIRIVLYVHGTFPELSSRKKVRLVKHLTSVFENPEENSEKGEFTITRDPDSFFQQVLQKLEDENTEPHIVSNYLFHDYPSFIDQVFDQLLRLVFSEPDGASLIGEFRMHVEKMIETALQTGESPFSSSRLVEIQSLLAHSDSSGKENRKAFRNLLFEVSEAFPEDRELFQYLRHQRALVNELEINWHRTLQTVGDAIEKHLKTVKLGTWTDHRQALMTEFALVNEEVATQHYELLNSVREMSHNTLKCFWYLIEIDPLYVGKCLATAGSTSRVLFELNTFGSRTALAHSEMYLWLRQRTRDVFQLVSVTHKIARDQPFTKSPIALDAQIELAATLVRDLVLSNLMRLCNSILNENFSIHAPPPIDECIRQYGELQSVGSSLIRLGPWKEELDPEARQNDLLLDFLIILWVQGISRALSDRVSNVKEIDPSWIFSAKLVDGWSEDQLLRAISMLEELICGDDEEFRDPFFAVGYLNHVLGRRVVTFDDSRLSPIREFNLDIDATLKPILKQFDSQLIKVRSNHG